MNTNLHVAPAQQLVLLGLQHQGRALEFSWQWPVAGGKVGFDAILAGMDGVDSDLLAQARYCSLLRVGPARQPVWLLSNSSHELVCSVNQQVLAAGSQIRLDHGDAIELGLTRLLVSLEPSHAVADPRLQDSPTVGATVEDCDNFDLTDLDALADIARLTDAEHVGLRRADFGDLISLMPEEQAMPVTVPVTVMPQDTEPTFADALAAGAEPSYAEKVSDLLAQFSAAADKPKLAQTPVDDPLQALHTQYLVKLRDPVHGDDQDVWSDIVRGDQSTHADPMQQWMQAAGPGRSLDDLLGQSQSIASVIQGLDPLGAQDVLAPEPFDSVMHLFAPGHLREPAPQARESLETLVQRSLPGLTRREHHSMSVDSAMPFTGGEEQPHNPE